MIIEFDAAATTICNLYREPPVPAGRGERVIGIDDLNAVRALERLPTGLPMAPGEVERREFE